MTVKIELKDWDYTCADNCCYDYGTAISVNGVTAENEYMGGNVIDALKFVLNQLSIDHEITET